MCGRLGRAGLAAGLALLAACAEPKSRPNVVLLLVDTLRADHLSLYGYPRETAPGLRAWAERAGAVFESARAEAPCTFPSVNTLLTSRGPGLFLAQAGESELGVPAGMQTLAAAFAAAGYETGAVSASPIVRATPSKENPGAGFGAGFGQFDEFCYWREAGCVRRRAATMLRALAPPFFLYVHFMDPHDPYRLPSSADLAERFAGPGPPGDDRAFVRRGDPGPLEAYLQGRGPDPGVTASELAHWVDLYDDEIRYWDDELMPLVREIRRRAGADAIVAVVSDHGEEFMEHGSVKHCRTLFDTELHVPLLLFAPGVAPRRIGGPVSLVDLAPTLLDLAGVDPPTSFEGRRLTRWLRTPADVAEDDASLQFATFGKQWAIVRRDYKLIVSARDDSESVFDLRRDPGELDASAPLDPNLLAQMRQELAAWQERNQHAAAEAGTRELERQLRAVGYLQ